MSVEKERMLQGKLYDPFVPDLIEMRHTAHVLSLEYNQLREDDPRREEIIKELVPHSEGLYLQGPIQFDYGVLTTFGKNCYANFNFTVLDAAPITIGDNVFFGPNCSLVTPIHPLLPRERNSFVRPDGIMTDREYAKPIVIHSNCWIACGVTICGGVTIGEGCVIGAGSVVTRSLPPHSLAVGNPCRVIRPITEEDSVALKEELQ